MLKNVKMPIIRPGKPSPKESVPTLRTLEILSVKITEMGLQVSSQNEKEEPAGPAVHESHVSQKACVAAFEFKFPGEKNQTERSEYTDTHLNYDLAINMWMHYMTYNAAKTTSTTSSPLAVIKAQTPTKQRRMAFDTFPIFMKKESVDGSRFLNPLQHASQQLV